MSLSSLQALKSAGTIRLLQLPSGRSDVAIVMASDYQALVCADRGPACPARLSCLLLLLLLLSPPLLLLTLTNVDSFGREPCVISYQQSCPATGRERNERRNDFLQPCHTRYMAVPCYHSTLLAALCLLCHQSLPGGGWD